MYLCITFLQPFQIYKVLPRPSHRVQLSLLPSRSLGLQTHQPLRPTKQPFISPNGISQAFSIVLFLDVAPPRDNVDCTLNCICLRRATDDDHNHSSNPVPILTHSSTGMPFLRLGPILISFILGSADVLRQNYLAFTFASRLHWRFSLFYLNHFYRDSTEKPHLFTSKYLQC